MKKILTAAVFAAAILTACNKQPLPSSDAPGRLQLTVSSSDKLTVKSAADDVDIDSFIITFTSVDNPSYTLSYTVGEFNETFTDGVITLNPGDFTIEVSSTDTADVEWEQPIYGCTKTVTIQSDVLTTIELVCTIQNMKVTVQTTEGFATEFEDYNVVVSGEYDGTPKSLTWTETEIAAGDAGYYKVSDLTVTIKAVRKSTGDDVVATATITDCAAADHHVITVGATDTGKAGFDIDIDDSTNDKDEDIDVPGFDNPELGEGTAPAITWASNPNFDPMDLADEMDVDLVVTASEGIETFTVGISSPTLTSIMLKVMGLSTTMDLINDESVVSVLGGLGLPVGEDLYGKTVVEFPLSGLLSMLYKLNPAEGTEHVFTLTVSDSEGQSVEQALTFVMPAASDEPEDTTPTITWEANSDFSDTYLASTMDVELVVTAPEGIETFIVTIDSPTLNYMLPLLGLSTTLDLITGDETTLTTLSGLGLPVGDDLYGKTSVNFSLSTLVPLIYSLGPAAGSEHVFTLTVTDSKEQKLEQTLTFIMPEE